MSNRRLFWFSLLILATLLLRDLPYLNVAVIGRMWIIYLLLALVLIFSSLKFRFGRLPLITAVFLVVAFVLTISNLTFFAEAVGVFLYFSFWIVLIYEIANFFRGR